MTMPLAHWRDTDSFAEVEHLAAQKGTGSATSIEVAGGNARSRQWLTEECHAQRTATGTFLMPIPDARLIGPLLTSIRRHGLAWRWR